MRPYRIQIIRHKPKFVDFEKTTDKQNPPHKVKFALSAISEAQSKTLLQITFLRYHDSMV